MTSVALFGQAFPYGLMYRTLTASSALSSNAQQHPTSPNEIAITLGLSSYSTVTQESSDTVLIAPLTAAALVAAGAFVPGEESIAAVDRAARTPV